MDRKDLAEAIMAKNVRDAEASEAYERERELYDAEIQRKADDAREIIGGTKVAKRKIDILLDQAGSTGGEPFIYDLGEATTQRSGLIGLGEVDLGETETPVYGFAQVEVHKFISYKTEERVVQKRFLLRDIVECSQVPDEELVTGLTVSFLSSPNESGKDFSLVENNPTSVHLSPTYPRAITKHNSLSRFIEFNDKLLAAEADYVLAQEFDTFSGEVSRSSQIPRFIENLKLLNERLDFVLTESDKYAKTQSVPAEA